MEKPRILPGNSDGSRFISGGGLGGWGGGQGWPCGVPHGPPHASLMTHEHYLVQTSSRKVEAVPPWPADEVKCFHGNLNVSMGIPAEPRPTPCMGLGPEGVKNVEEFGRSWTPASPASALCGGEAEPRPAKMIQQNDILDPRPFICTQKWPAQPADGIKCFIRIPS